MSLAGQSLFFSSSFAGDVEGVAVVGDATHKDMGVRVAGIVVIDRDPVELRPEVSFHLCIRSRVVLRGSASSAPLSAEMMKRNRWRSSRPPLQESATIPWLFQTLLALSFLFKRQAANPAAHLLQWTVSCLF